MCENEILNFSQWASFAGSNDDEDMTRESFLFQRQRINALKFRTAPRSEWKWKMLKCVWKMLPHFSHKKTHKVLFSIQSLFRWNLKACNLKCKFSLLSEKGGKLEFAEECRGYNPKGHITFKCFTSFVAESYVKMLPKHFLCVPFSL